MTTTVKADSPLKNTLFGLDHLRAFAIIIVFFYHYSGIFGHPEWVRSFFKFGWTGVDLFFVLSGYLISSQLFTMIAAGKKISFPRFFLKRFFRIIPAYLVVLVLYFLLPSFREREGLAPLWKYLSFTQNIGLDLRQHGTFSHAWSLCIEEQFYLFLPLILIALVSLKKIKAGVWILLLLFIAGFLIRIYSWDRLITNYGESNEFGVNWYTNIYYPTWCRLDGLLIGVSIAAIFQFRSGLKAWLIRYANYFFSAGILILTGAYLLCDDEQSFDASIFGFPLVSIGYGCLVLSAISPTNFLYRSGNAITSAIARLSYAIYLSHKIVIHITQVQISKLGIQENSTLMLLFCILASLLCAWLLNRSVERPFLKLRDRILHHS